MTSPRELPRTAVRALPIVSGTGPARRSAAGHPLDRPL